VVTYERLARAVEIHGGGILAPRPTHHEPRAKHLIVIFLTGGFSHVDTFDYKPKLKERDGKPVPSFGLRPDETRERPLLGSPFRFQACGESGLFFSELFPRLGDLADDLCVIRSLHTDIVEHFQAVLAMHTGSATVPMPSLGAWISHGLGTFNPNLPSHVVLCQNIPYAGTQVWDSGFLPPIHQGVRIIPGREPIPDLRPSARPVSLRELERIMLDDANKAHAASRPDDAELRARIATFDIARGMMREAPEVLDVAGEPRSIRRLYNLADGDTASFGYQCLIARRLIERGVRVVELIDTGAKGRNHYAKAFTSLLAGAGVKGGHAHGQTDEFGINIQSDPVHVHDYHATILHLMGIDHTRLVYRHAGRDFRLTDVDGNVIQAILA
jgi:hypothetical protein